ncbi:WXG100 family type VII secretion target [Nocardia fluminea]|uniref:WXG100 family type VII secretion target n=1 Tax=Nocardia fluminea TaxID=134984 RepID=UPI0014766ABE|nr:WXG100 family type VII secretion target [Nocardia fluminea]
MSTGEDAPGTNFAIVPDEVTDAGAYVEQVASSLISGLNSLDREVSSVLGNWKGSAADAFGEGWTVAKEGAATVLDALEAMGGLLGVASKTIAGRDISNATTFNSLDLPDLNM